MPDSARVAPVRRPSFTAATLLVAAGVVLASVATVSQVRGATFTFAPTADAYVSSGATSTNFGTATTLLASGGSTTNRSYLQFNVQGLTGAATSANLAVWVLSTSGGASARSLTTPGTAWTELGITWNNAPALNATVKTLGALTVGTWANFDVTSIVTGSGNLTIGVTTTTSASFASKEDAAHPPQLTVVGPGAATVPGAPTNVSAVAGSGQATVTWNAPASDGGSPITGYTVTSSPSGGTATPTGPTSANVTGLTNGQSYTFTVRASNSVGPGPASAASIPVTPTAPVAPGAPTGVSAVAGNTQATVTWTIPASDGGSPISGYTVTSTNGGFTGTASGPTATSAIVTGLNNGTPYSFTVHATNGQGAGPESSPASTPVTPSTIVVPDPPTNVGAAPGNLQATVTWTIPASDGGSPISGYTATSAPGSITKTVSGASTTSAVVTGLANNTSYTFTVRATNSMGPGPASAASNVVTPSASQPVLRRNPYLTDTGATSTLVNFATSAASPLPTVRWGLSGNCANPPNSVTATAVVNFAGTASGTTVYQVKAAISGLSANTAYCYRVFQNGGDLLGASVTFTTALAAGSATPFSFAVMGDWGQGTTAEANVFSQIAASHPSFLMTVGDNVYNGGSNTEYGDLNGGNVFPAGYLPKLGGAVPIFAAQGNHGFTTNLPYLQTFPQQATAAASLGKFGVESYCCAAGTSGTSNYASSWYAFTWGRARFYVLEAAWGDSNGAYQGDSSSHWNGSVPGCTPCGQEMSWLQTDLLNNASVPLKFAFFHYPIYADSSGQGSDSYLNGAAPHLEGVLATAGVGIVFTGHAHQYERNIKQAGGPLLVNYVTGGGGAALGSVSSCHTWDAYAIGSSGRCGTGPAPPSAFHYLLVSVIGNQVTVTPTDQTGNKFDVQTYTFGAANAAPTITSANSTTFPSGSSGSFTVTSTGSPTPALSESGALPAGVTFTPNANGTATLAGTSTASGSYPLTITAANGVLPNATRASP